MILHTMVKHCFPQGVSGARGSRTLFSSPWQCPEGFVAREEALFFSKFKVYLYRAKQELPV